MALNMDITPQNLRQKLLVLQTATAKESMTQVAITQARSICVLFQLLIKPVHQVVYMRKPHQVITRIFLIKLLSLV